MRSCSGNPKMKKIRKDNATNKSNNHSTLVIPNSTDYNSRDGVPSVHPLGVHDASTVLPQRSEQPSNPDSKNAAPSLALSCFASFVGGKSIRDAGRLQPWQSTLLARVEAMDNGSTLCLCPPPRAGKSWATQANRQSYIRALADYESSCDID